MSTSRTLLALLAALPLVGCARYGRCAFDANVLRSVAQALCTRLHGQHLHGTMGLDI